MTDRHHRNPHAEETEQYQLFETSQYKYRVFVTDMSDPIYFVVWFYGQRGGAENLIKEANNDAGLAAHPSNRFDVNGNHFQLAMLAYNLNCWLMLFNRMRQRNRRVDKGQRLGLLVLDCPGCGREFCEPLNRDVSKAGQNGGQVFADRNLQPTAGFNDGQDGRHFWPGLLAPTWIQFFRPRATGRIEFSARLLLSSNSGYSRKRVSFRQSESV